MKKRKLTRKKRNKKNKQNTKKEFLENLKVTYGDKKSKNIMNRKNAEINDEKRKCEYLKAMSKILEKKDEDALEI